jgi:lysyl-tRNA synthetase class 2
MSSLEEIRDERMKKLNLLKEKGIDPFPATVNRTHRIDQVIVDFDGLEKSGEEVTIAGRVMVRRGQGAILFCDVKDMMGRFQAVLKKDEIDEESFNLFNDAVDGGDFVEMTGTVFVTQSGQQSLLVKSWRMLTKALLPLPDKFHGLKDEDTKLRKRYLDILSDDELFALFTRKDAFWRTVRNFMQDRGFLEVETPTLEVTTGGAEARPFETHHNDFDIDVYLRISIGELWQKRLMAAGFEKTFEIGRAYRN